MDEGVSTLNNTLPVSGSFQGKQRDVILLNLMATHFYSMAHHMSGIKLQATVAITNIISGIVK